MQRLFTLRFHHTLAHAGEHVLDQPGRGLHHAPRAARAWIEAEKIVNAAGPYPDEQFE